MAIIKLVNVRSGKPYGLKAVLDYIQNPLKTKDGLLVSAKDCMVETAYQQMVLMKVNHAKTSGRQYIHIIQSFPIGEDVTPEVVHQIGQQLLQGFHGYQAIVATHTDRAHIHNHIVLNTVHQETGYKWQFSKEQLYTLRERSDALCQAHGLSIIQKGQGWRSYGEQAGDSWKRRLALDITESLESSLNREMFLHEMRRRGIEVDFGKKNIMFTLPDGKKCSNHKLMVYGDFSKENIENHLQYTYLAPRVAARDYDTVLQGFRELSGVFPDQDASRMANQFMCGTLPKLEGQALVEWLIKKKGSSSVNYENNPQSLEERQRGFLETIHGALEALLWKEEMRNRPRPAYRDMDDEDEWEL